MDPIPLPKNGESPLAFLAAHPEVLLKLIRFYNSATKLELAIVQNQTTRKGSIQFAEANASIKVEL